MLSTENPPPDSSEIPQLKSGSSNFISSDGKASDNDNNNNNNQPQLDVDLFKSGLDDINQTLPKFTIRDYVFSTRGKDIKTRWPFSPKNLQLCLKHGMKDVLPPFETLEYVRNPSSIVKCANANKSNPGVKLSGPSNHLLSVSSKNASQKLASDTENIKSNTSEKEKEYYPLTTTSLSCCDVNSVLFLIQSPFLEPESENLPDLEKPVFAVRANKVKSINITQNPAKKCRLIVKLGNNISEQKSKEDLLETMASKVCPVCKTFTSSSNTTLNAHIDQCLSGESRIKWTANSKVMKHRIKSGKTRLMVDIYATALCCTLEDLDRRNGTNWASNLGFPAQDLDNSSSSSNNNNNNNNNNMNGEEKNEGSVYFDSNGTKLCILSKFSDVKSNTNGEDDCGPRKLVKRENGSKIVTSKKKYFVQRHKVLKCPPYEQRRCSPRLDRCPEVNGAREMNFLPEENEKEDLPELLKACDQTKSDDSGMIKQWVSSKRTGHKKKKNPEHESHRPNKITKNLRIKSHLPSLDDKLIKRTSDLRFPMSSDDNPFSATDRSHKRKESMPLNSDDEYMPCRTNRVGFSLLDSRDYYGDKKNHMMLSRSNFKRLKGKGPSVPNGTGNHAVSRSNKKMRSISSTVNVDSSFISSRLSKHGIFSSGGKEFGSLKKTFVGKKLSSLSKKLLSVGHTSFSESKKFLGRKRLDFKKSAFHMQNNLVERRGRNAAAQMEDSGNLSIDGARILKIRKKRWEFVNNGKENDTSSKHSNASSESNSHGVEQNMDSFMSDGTPACTSNVIKVVGIRDEFVREAISKISGGEALVGFDESLAYEGHCSPDLVLSGEQEMLCAEKDDVNEGEGNYFVHVDPIPIPGPPGSFLPSPGRMGSEELQGNSSLTTCKIHSSEDDCVLIDHMDSSDSPVFGTSFISNSIAARSDSKLPFRSHAVQCESQCDVFENRTDLGADGPKLDESRTKLVIPETKSPICDDCESPSLSTSNPVLRLMGKNLMVVNKEEINLSPQTRPIQLSAVNDFHLQLPVDNVTSIGNIRNEHEPIFHNLSRGPPVLDNSQTCMELQHFDFASSVGLGFRSNFKTLDLSPHLSRVILSTRTSNEGLRSSLDCQEYASGYVFTHDQLGSTVKLDNPIRHEVEKVHAHVPRLRTSDSCCGRPEEIIVIDDSPRNEASLGFKTTYAESKQVGSLRYDDSRHVNPFFGYQTRCYPMYCETQMGQHVNTHAAPYNGMNGNSVIWNRTPEGRDFLTASMPSTGHPRSSLYFSSGFLLPTNFT